MSETMCLSSTPSHAVRAMMAQFAGFFFAINWRRRWRSWRDSMRREMPRYSLLGM